MFIDAGGNGFKRAGTHMQRDFMQLDALLGKLFDQVLCKMQTSSGSRDRPRIFANTV